MAFLQSLSVSFPVYPRGLSWGPFFSSFLIWAYLSETLIKDSNKRLSSTENDNVMYYKSLDHTLLLRTCYGEVYGNIAREENG